MSNAIPLSEWYNETRRCMRCGLCRGACPVFDVVDTEPSASRGKVQLVRALLEERLEPTETLKQLVSLCLNCGACAANCPSGVRVHEIVLSARAELMSQLGQPLMERLMLRGVAADSGRLALGSKATALYQKTGLRWLAHKTRLLDALPGDLRGKDKFIPNLPLRSARGRIPPLSGPKDAKARVAYFLGCTSNLLEPSLAVTLVRVLARNNYQVLVPPKLECCGMPHLSYGDVETARRLERANVEALNQLEVDAIVVDCATCGSTIKRYEGLKAPVYDICEYAADNLGMDLANSHGFRARVTYHDPCHLVRGQSISAAPRQMLRSIPDVEFVEMAEADRCCGGGGSFNLTHYEVSMSILDRKTTNILETGAEVVATGCPSCRMQLRHGLKREKERRKTRGLANSTDLPQEVLHPIELVARAMGFV